jgi:parallel beta-helix repeat protein
MDEGHTVKQGGPMGNDRVPSATRREFLQWTALLASGPWVPALLPPVACQSRRPSRLASVEIQHTVTCEGFTASAIVDCLKAAGPGTEIYLPAGNYTIDQSIVIPTDRLVLRGAGRATVLQATDNSFNMIRLSERREMRLADFAIRGAGTDGPGGVGIHAYKVQACQFDNLWIERCGSADAAGIYLDSSQQNQIADCHVEANGRGIFLYRDSSGNTIDGCTGHANAKEMIFLSNGCRDCVISNCVSDNDGSSSPAVSIAIHRSDRSRLVSCTVLRSGKEQGVEIAAGDDNVVMSCTISDSNWAGLHIVNAQRVLVANNTITGNKQSGITLRSDGDPSEVRPSDYCVIRGNLIADNNSDGAAMQGTSRAGIEIERGNHVTIEGNQIRNNRGAAIYVGPGNVGTEIHGNEIGGSHAAHLVNQGVSTVADIQS